MRKKWELKKRRELLGCFIFLFAVAFAMSTMIGIVVAAPYSIRIQQADNVGQMVSNVIINGPNLNDMSGANSIQTNSLDVTGGGADVTGGLVADSLTVNGVSNLNGEIWASDTVGTGNSRLGLDGTNGIEAYYFDSSNGMASGLGLGPADVYIGYDNAASNTYYGLMATGINMGVGSFNSDNGITSGLTTVGTDLIVGYSDPSIGSYGGAYGLHTDNDEVNVGYIEYGDGLTTPDIFHGLTVTNSMTTLSGGTSSTTQQWDDLGSRLINDYGTPGQLTTFSVDTVGNTMIAGDLDMTGGNVTNVLDLTATGTIQGGTLTDGTLSINSGAITGATDITASGTIQGGTLTDGTLSINSGAITGATDITASGTIQGGTLTDGTLSINSGAITGATDITASGTIQGGTLTDGTLSINSGAITGATDITASGTIQGGTLTDGTLSINSGAITGATDITASGTIQGGTLTDGTAVLTGGNLTTTGTVQAGTLVSTGDTNVGNNLNVTGNADVGGNLAVTGTTTLTDNLTANGTTNRIGTAGVSTNTITGANNNITASGTNAISGNINTITATTRNTMGVTGGSTITTTATQVTALTNDGSGLTVNNNVTAPGATVISLLNNTDHGLTVNTDSTVLSGGTTSTTLTLNNDGATFANTTTGGGPARVTGVADGVYDYDAVNVRQLHGLEEAIQKANIGVASISALSAIPGTLPGKRFAVGAGYGYFEDESAVAIGMKARLWDNLSVTAGLGFGVGRSVSTYSANAGFSFSF
jgi:hypothetical protein